MATNDVDIKKQPRVTVIRGVPRALAASIAVICGARDACGVSLFLD